MQALLWYRPAGRMQQLAQQCSSKPHEVHHAKALHVQPRCTGSNNCHVDPCTFHRCANEAGATGHAYDFFAMLLHGTKFGRLSAASWNIHKS